MSLGTEDEKRRIVEETLAEEASVARAHGGNANEVFCWRKLYLVGGSPPERSDQAVAGHRSRELVAGGDFAPW